MNEVLEKIKELRLYQEKALLKLGRKFVPSLTSDDILQPNDFAELELNPHFRYEEGLLHGIQSVEAALQALQSEITTKQDHFK
jgi:hypothetical protein